jgi:hypothetical protein
MSLQTGMPAVTAVCALKSVATVNEYERPERISGVCVAGTVMQSSSTLYSDGSRRIVKMLVYDGVHCVLRMCATTEPQHAASTRIEFMPGAPDTDDDVVVT